jgi:PD-(D/E)XK endonuclease
VKKNYHLYLGKAGHLAVMSEFLIRGWNVAIPEVDIGDDIFVVQDDNGTLRRVQVKTATSVARQSNYSAQFNVPLTQLKNITNIPVHYVFVVRHNHQWNKPVIIRQDYLLDHFLNDQIGSENQGNLVLYFSYSAGKAECSGLDFSKYVSDFTDFPLVSA